MVSVIMSVYNETEKELRLAVDSILNQTYQDIEFIIVLDNPENILLKKILLNYQKQNDKISLSINNKNVGLAESLNKAFSISKGSYIARMDADDISYSTRIEKQVQYMEEHIEYAIVGTNREDIDENGTVICKDRCVITDYKKIIKLLKYGSPLTHPSIMIRREVFQSLEGYRKFQCAQDYDLYLRCLLRKYKITNLNEVLLQYRVRENSITVQNSFRQRVTADYIRKLYKKAKKNHKYASKYLENDFENFCKRKGVYNSDKTEAYIKFKKASKERRLKEIIWIVFKNPEFSIYLLKTLICFCILKSYEKMDNIK